MPDHFLVDGTNEAVVGSVQTECESHNVSLSTSALLAAILVGLQSLP